MRRGLAPCVAAAVLLLGQLSAAGASGAADSLPLHLVNFNFETVQVTWDARDRPGANLTFLYKFMGAAAYAPCPRYMLQGGHTAGCLLDAPGDEMLLLSLWDGAHCVANRSVWISLFLKPSSPQGLNFRWHQDALTVTCAELPYEDLLYEVQHRTAFDSEWQATEEEACNVTVQGLDAEKCYFVRARVKAMEASYGLGTSPSDWSEVAHLQRDELRDSCAETPPVPKFALISGMVFVLTVALALLLAWKLRRVKRLLMPSVPDPKVTFLGLFEAHRGNFQEWIKDTENVTQLDKVEEGEHECVLEEAPLVRRPKADTETPTDTATHPLSLQTDGGEAAGDPSQHLCQPPQGQEVISLGGFTFLMSDNSYVTL